MPQCKGGSPQGPIVLDSRFVEPPLFTRAHCSFCGGDADDTSGGVDGTASAAVRPAKIYQAISLNVTALATHVGGGPVRAMWPT